MICSSVGISAGTETVGFGVRGIVVVEAPGTSSTSSTVVASTVPAVLSELIGAAVVAARSERERERGDEGQSEGAAHRGRRYRGTVVSGPRATRRGDGLDRPQQRRHEPVGAGDDGVVLAVDAERLGARDRVEQLDLAPQRHDAVAHRDDDRGRHVDLSDPRARREVADRAAGLEHHPPVVRGGLLHRPRLPREGLALQVELLGQPLARLGRRDPGEGGEPGQAEEREPLAAELGEVRRRRAQHQAVDPFAVAVPHQLGDRAAHRVADGDEPVDAERVGDGDHVVGEVLETERPLAADPACRGRDGRTRTRGSAGPSGCVARVPVDVGRRRPAVEEGDRGRTGRAAEVAHEDRAAALELDVVPRRERSGPGLASVATSVAQARSTFRTRTRSSPFGASYDTHCPASAPTRAAPSGAVGLITSRPSICSSMWPTR